MPVSPFWSTYGSAITKHLGAVGPHDEVFALPFTIPFTDAIRPLPDEHVNFLLYNLANTTLSADGSNGSYATELNAYLKAVLLDSHQTPGAQEDLDKAANDLKAAQKNLEKTESEAQKEYKKDRDRDRPPFEQWTNLNYPEYGYARDQLSSAETGYHQAYDYFHGQGFDELQKHQKKVAKALDTKADHPSYNMPVRNDKGNSTFAPYYRSGDLERQLNQWIKHGGKSETLFEVKVDDATPPGTKAKHAIYLKFTTKGLYKCEIDLGLWDIPDVKTLYPKRKSGASNALDPKYARPISFLLAYDPKLEVEIKEGTGEDVKLNDSATSGTSDDKPYVAVLGILGRHFAA
ncbi:hypothetical protein DXG01_002666 [Tephrocybe rancida]|nr:hypothetical protein DXG01_002666 [Tephrocybe rancida]